uniref:GATA-type domain-containing protein n=1 Tax=Oryza punctata TaxID=4537 RepID=A0A0E0L5V8_ORYPU
MLQELAPCTCGMLYGSCGGGCGGAAAHVTTATQVGGGLPPWDVPSSACPGGGKQDAAGVATCNKEAPAAGRLPRRCANCDTTSTPLWRNGPRGPKSLCNACGIRYKKEERRAAAAVAPAPPSLDTGAGYAYCYSRQPAAPAAPQWGCYGQAAAKSASYAMFGDIVDAADDGPCLSWRLNMMPSSPAFAVGERPGLFQYY